MSTPREKLTTRIDTETLSATRRLAEMEGRQLQSLVNEALVDLIKKYRLGPPRPHVMEAYRRSHTKYADLYMKLA